MTLRNTLSDLDVLRLMNAGDEEAFATLYARRQRGIYRFALQMSGSEALAEDVTQEVFMVLIRQAHGYDPSRGSVTAYLYGIARNHVLRRFEEDRLLVPLVDSPETGDGTTHPAMIAGDNPLDDLTRNEMIETVRNSILTLPAHYREVLVLCDLHEMSYAEAGIIVGCAVGTVRSRLHRARALLVDKLRAGHDRNSGPEEVNPARCFA